MKHDSGYHGFRPRLQRRDRDGLSPSSLLNPLAYGYLNLLVIKEPAIPVEKHPLGIGQPPGTREIKKIPQVADIAWCHGN
jgi:hypothetical protein